jgi:O-antigen/teichoic acid export membrane protein
MRAWLERRFLPSSMEITLNSGSLIATTGVTSALGVAYWWLAAHEFPASAVGLAGALVSAMTLLGVVSTIGFSTALIPELAESSGPSRAALILSALIAVSVAGVVLGAVWQAVAPRLEPGLGLPEAGAGAVLLFAAGVSLTALALVLDQALVGLLRGELQLFRNTVFAVVKLLALLAAGVWMRGRGAETIYATWAAGQVASLVALAVLVARGPAGLVISRPRMPRALRGAALVHHTFNLALAGPSWILPLIVTVLVSTTANAYFYTAWTVAGFVFVGPIALTTVLYAVGAQPARDLGRPLQLTLLLSLFWGVVTAAGCLLLGSTVLGTFGRAYGLQAGSALFLLSLAVFPQVAKLHYVALARIRGQLGVGILLALAGGMLELALAAFGAQRAGIRGLATGWLVATCVEAAAVLPYLVRSVIRLRRQHPPDGQAPAGGPHTEPREQSAWRTSGGPWERWARL